MSTQTRPAQSEFLVPFLVIPFVVGVVFLVLIVFSVPAPFLLRGVVHDVLFYVLSEYLSCVANL